MIHPTTLSITPEVALLSIKWNTYLNKLNRKELYAEFGIRRLSRSYTTLRMIYSRILDLNLANLQS
jgi:hypothetical protein